MKDTTKLGLAAVGVLGTVAGIYFGHKFVSTKGFGKFTKTVADAAQDSGSELSDAAKEVVDEVKDSID